MQVKILRDNCDGKGPQIVETEVPDPTTEEIAARAAKREERMKTRTQPKPE